MAKINGLATSIHVFYIMHSTYIVELPIIWRWVRYITTVFFLKHATSFSFMHEYIIMLVISYIEVVLGSGSYEIAQD